MIPNLDIYLTAQVLVMQHGEDIPLEAAMRADAMLETGDLDGYRVCQNICLWDHTASGQRRWINSRI